MLVCDACDKGYHTFCLQPAMDSLPTDPWKCRVSHIRHLFKVDPSLNKKNERHSLERSVFQLNSPATLIKCFFRPYVNLVRGVVYVWSVAFVGWFCLARCSGLTTTQCVRPASVSAPPCVASAAKLRTHLWLFSAAPCATGFFSDHSHTYHLWVSVTSGLAVNYSVIFYPLRWVHRECEIPEVKSICLLCKEDQHQQERLPEAHTTQTQTAEVADETEGQIHLVEMTIQTEADMMTEKTADVIQGQGGTSKMGLAATTAEEATPMDLGSSVPISTSVSKILTLILYLCNVPW